MVPAEGIEPPTFGLQNRCSTAELSRLLVRRMTSLAPCLAAKPLTINERFRRSHALSRAQILLLFRERRVTRRALILRQPGIALALRVGESAGLLAAFTGALAGRGRGGKILLAALYGLRTRDASSI